MGLNRYTVVENGITLTLKLSDTDAERRGLIAAQVVEKADPPPAVKPVTNKARTTAPGRRRSPAKK